MQTPMISSPLKQTSEIDWIQPLKAYIRETYGEDPEKYSEECATLHRLRQDMRGAGKDSAAGRDLLYRYYGQLELLDLRFPVDENHIKISFTWFDAFTHKPTSQYSLAYEKASIIFNISAVLSCHAANQNRSEDTGLKTAYHSFQASAGMFNYINENFLHAPSTDLSRDTVKTLISITLAQGQEVFLEKQIADGKKFGLLAKLASQAASLYAQSVEGLMENVAKGTFERVWLQLAQIKTSYMASLSQYYQALADDDANNHGIAIARLYVAETHIKDGSRSATAFPSTMPPSSNLGSDTGASLVEMTKRHLTNVQEKSMTLTKDNDFIYHQTVPAEASLSVVPKLPAAKAIPVSELYQGQDIQRIIGPDIFSKIVPMSVTESASLYDEEKAKLVRAEAEKIEQANDEMAASLDYLKLPESLNVLRGGMDQEISVDNGFKGWCEELAGHEPFSKAFDHLQSDKSAILGMLDSTSKQLDLEENVCEKMRVKYSSEWTQQPSSRLNSTLRGDIRSYREAIDQADVSDAQLLSTSQQYEQDFEQMRSAGDTDEADVLYQSAMMKAGGKGKGKNAISSSAEGSLLDDDYGEGGETVMEQIARIEELLKKLNLVKKDRVQVLKDLKEKVQSDDISNVLILNKKSIANHENKLFETELEKFRSHQNRLLQANHKQSSLLKELTRAYSNLLQDKRVRSEQAKYESFNRQRSAVLTRYRKVFTAFNDLISGLMRAQSFYSEMRDTVENLEKNIDTFVNNRREEGGQLLAQIEQSRQSSSGNNAERERDRLQSLMERMNVQSSPPLRAKSSASRPSQASRASQSSGFSNQLPPTSPPYSSPTPTSFQPSRSPAPNAFQGYPSQHPTGVVHSGYQDPSHAPTSYQPGYDPMQYPYQQRSPPVQQGYLPQQASYPYAPSPALPQGYVPPPPPPGPPPGGQQYYVGQQPPRQDPSAQGYGYGQPSTQRHGTAPSGQDPWAGLGAWK